MSDITSRLSDLSPERRKLLALKLKQKAAAGRPAAAEAGDGGAEHPASFAQRRLWVLERLQPGSPAYNIPGAVRFRGAVDAEALERALGELVRRHQSLRTRLETRGDEPVQVVLPASEWKAETVDLTHLPAEEAEAELARRAQHEVVRPFAMGEDPLFRAVLVRVAADDVALLWTAHHAVSDGWSSGVLMRDLTALYEALSRGEPSPLPPLALQYGDHAAEERERLAGDALAARLAYWRDALSGAPALLELPTDRPRPPAPSGLGASYEFGLAEGTGARVEAFAREAGATPFMVLLAAFQSVLSRWSRQDDVVVGTPVANRPRPELEPLIGFFANTLALRGDLSGDPSFRALVGRVREATLGAFEHQDLPFEKLVEELQPERSLSHTPLFQVMFVLQNAGGGGDAAGPQGVRLEGIRRQRESARFDLVLSLIPRGGDLVGIAEYSLDLFDAATVERLVRHVATLLDSALATPDAPLSALEMLEPGERAALAAAGAATAEFPVARTIQHVFAAQAARTPDAPAVTFGGRTMTYRELDEAANRLANHLRARGARPDTLVGLAVERSLETVVGILGILKSGAGYLPLDPAYPEDRLAYMVEDSGVSLVVSVGDLADRLQTEGTAIVRLDADAEAIAAESAGAPEDGAGPASLAYVIYTSGSTGKPKGVEVTHANVVRLFTATDHWFGFGEADVWTLFHSYAFDFSVWEIWGALLYGGRLVVVPFDVSRSPEEFYALLETEGVTILNQTPSAFRQLMRVDEEAAGRGQMRALALRAVVFGGEALDPATLRGWVDRRGDASPRLINMYGITETTVHVTYREIREADVRGGSASPIGVPIPDLSVHLLDPHGRVVSTGVVGEMYVGGGGVARGYLNRPDLTAQRFVRDPFSADPSARLYRSGDLARRLADGSLVFHGRADDQVKVRGFRIELGEIETVLLDHAEVREAVVLTRGEGDEKRLVAWVVPAAGAELSAADLRTHLGARLPEYMVPSAFVVLDALPLTRNGKVDRRALPEPEGGALAGAAYVAPRTRTEEILAAVWAELLGVERVGVEDGFFALGGHSLLATRLVSRVREVLGVEIALRAVFESPTLGDLAARVDEALLEHRAAAASPLVRAGRDEEVPLSYGQERLWVMERLNPGELAYGIVHAVALPPEVDAGAVERAVSEIVRRHEALRTVFRAVERGAVQRVLPAAAVDLPVADVRHLPEDEQLPAAREVVGAASAEGFDLERGPLLRARLVRMADRAMLAVVIHHSVFDGWSIPVLDREVRALVDAFSAGLPSPLPELPVQYADWAAWQRRAMEAGELDEQVRYWRQALAGAPEVLDLPADRPRPAVRSYAGARRLFHLPASVIAPARELARRERATLFMVLLAAYDVLLARLAGTDDVVVGTQVAGRTRGEVEGLIGFFVNNLALRTDLSGDPSFRQLVGRVRRVALNAFAHQEVPFQRLVDELGVERSLSHSPVFQASLVLQTTGFDAGVPGAAPDGEGEPELPREPIARASQYELTFDLREHGAGIVGTAGYSTELFDHETAERFVAEYRRLLEALVAAPDAPISAPAPAEEAEARGIDAWNATGRPLSAEPIHRVFEARVAETPMATAVVDADGNRWSYVELNARANRLARRLVALGAGPERRVAVMMERSAGMVAALYAVLKSGAAYVPVDPGYPADRVAHMLGDAAASIVLTHSSLAGGVDLPGATVIAVDTVDVSDEEEVDLSVDADPASLAYAIYTSGSTGLPKGAGIPHRALSNHMAWMQDAFPLAPGDRVLQKTPFSFDASVWEFHAPLLAGATLVMASPDAHRDPAALLAEMAEHGVTILQVVPTLLRVLLDEPALARATTLRRLFAGGEALAPDLVRRLHDVLPQVQAVNLYGPTETCIDATFHAAAPDEARATVPIGRPVHNTRVHVLDGRMRPVAPGVPGELFVAGAQVGRGYLGKPALTAAAFVPDPFSAAPGARMYRTGDRARWRRDGVLEFLGRIDQQVKVRGFRIEPGEVESAIREMAGVREAVVVARAEAGASARLVAYVVAAEGAAVDAAALRARLSDRLPAFMVPSAFVALDRIPLTPGGKVDRRALPAPAPESAVVEAGEAPRDPVEATLAAVWAGVLGVDAIGVHDNFFALGGDSILAIQAVSRAARAGLRITARQIFQHQTVAELARHAEPVTTAADAEAQAPVVGPAPLTPIQRSFFARGYAEPHHWNMARLLAASAPVDPGALERAVAAVLEHHDALRLRFARGADGEWAQSFAAPGEAVPVEVADLSAFTGDALSAAIHEHAAQAQASLDLAHGPVTRVVLYRGGAGERDRVLWIAHHLVMDAVSWRILLEDLETAYTRIAAGEAVDLPPRTTSYRRWAERLADHARTPELRAEAETWLAQPWETAAPLPAGAAEGAGTQEDARHVVMELDEEATRALLQEVPPVYGTQVNDALLAALSRALGRWTGGPAVAVELEGHGREELFDDVDLTRTVGWFTSIFPVLLDAEGDDAGALLRAAKERLRAVPARGVGFGILRWLSDDAALRAKLAAIPVPEVSFNYVGQIGGGGASSSASEREPWLGAAREGAGPLFAARDRRTTAVEVLASVRNGRLRVVFVYPGRRFEAEAVERVAADYEAALREIVAHCRAASGGYTPSDFPLAGLGQAALDRLLDEVGGRARGTVEDVYPLTPLQEGMLFHALEGETGVYYQELHLPLRGELDEEAMARAWAAVVERTPILRTVFAWRELERPLQVVLRGVDFEVMRLDWRGLSPEEAGARLDEHRAADRLRGFSPQGAPLMRVALVRTGERAWELLVSFHHLLLDGWSMPRVLADVGAHYASVVGGEPAPRPRRPFRDYVAWLESRDEGAAEAFWRGELAGFEGAARVFGEAEAVRTPREFAVARALIPSAEGERLRERAGRAGLTATTLYQGALAVLLARFTGQDDVAFGNVVSGRPAELEGVEEMVGMMINTVPVRTRVPAPGDAGEWLRALQSAQAEARQHDHVPLVEIRRWAGLEPGRELFDTLFVFENYPLPSTPAGRRGSSDSAESADSSNAADSSRTAETTEDAAAAERRQPVERTNYPLAFAVAPTSAGVKLRLTYDAERFDAATAARLLEAWQAVLARLAEGVVPALPEEERARVLAAAAGPASSVAPAPFHRLFESVAARTPEAPAIRFAGDSTSYAALNARANRIARRLRALGAGAETLVAVSLDRSPDGVAAMLAVNKAGGAFLPVDPAYPLDRRAFMLADSGARVIVTTSPLAADLPEHGAAVLLLDQWAAEIEAEEDGNLPIEVDAESAAYVIYTSGSTGTPKGVVVAHRGLANLAAAQGEAFAIGVESRVLQFASPAFDAAVAEVAHTLLSGATLVMADADALAPGGGLMEILRGERVSVATLPPSVLSVVQETDLPDLRTIVSAGEAVTADVVARWGEGRRFVNAYGPTETTVCATAAVDPAAVEPVTVGRPIAGMRAYVLDARMEPAPLGVPGELYVGGVGVARGYLGRAGLTAERFVPDGFSGEAGARLYRTGDRARMRADGALEFLGRADHQVKLRGFRIEPGEIEAVLRAHPSVREALVLARGEGDARRLVAYVTPSPADAEALTSHAAARLPEYMVPAAIVALHAFPLTPNGKIDRRALPDPEFVGEAYVAPRTPTEEALAAIWAELLRVERVGAADSFFALGGHSLVATRLVSRVRAELGVELPVRAVFEHPTLAALAAEVDRLGAAAADAPIRRGTENDLPLSFAQERLWFIDTLEPGSTLYNMPTALRLRGVLDVPAMERALGEVVRRHDTLRTRLARVDGAPVQRIEPALGFRLPVDDLSALTEGDVEEEVVRRAAGFAAEPFDLEAGPLFRARLLRVAADDHVLVVSMHHVVSDGWSVGVFWRETAALYGAFSRGEASPLPELPVRYADFAAWQRTWLSGERLAGQVRWWRDHLAGAPAVLELPTDRPRPPVQSHRGADLAFTVPAETAEAVRALAAREGATEFMAILAAWSLILSRWSGQDDVVVGTPVAGRTRAEVEGLIGLFVNTLPIRAELDGDPSFRALLARVREAVLGAFAHQDLPFERLVEELAPQRSLSHAPVFQALLVMQNTPTGADEGFAGLELGGVSRGGGDSQAKVDLTLTLLRAADEGMRGVLSYAADLWDAATMERMTAHLATLLRSAAESPDAPVSTLEILADGERAALVAAASATAEHPVTRTIPDLFAAQAARTPDAPAVTFGARSMTYRELDEASSRLANHLRTLGARPDGLVGLCVERSLETVVGILGIVKAGAGYLPLDPAYPEDRLAYMVEDSGVSIVVSVGDLADRLPTEGTTIVRLDADVEAIAAEPADAPEHGAAPASLAYVIYTSGSTGKPKGVQVTHANVIRLFTATDHWFGFGAADVWTLFHSYAFDFSVWEIWGALLYGGRLVVVPFDVSRAPEEFYALLEAEGVTVLNQTPSAFRQLMRADEEAASRGAMRDLALRYVVFGGEALDPATLRGWVERRGDDRPLLVNMYGITETTVHVTYREIREADVVDGSSSPIGVPIPDLSVHLLDRHGRLVPTGVVGEMYVGGGGVARGYLNRPELTAQRFVRDPFSADPAARLYRSGDLARRLPDGSLEFHGRADDQVKVRGFRIELGEIESVLLDHPRVREAVVLTRGEGDDRRLAAWVVPAIGGDVTAAELRAHLGAHLPEYMVPGAFVLMDALPLTRNGKVDRRALPEPEGDARAGAAYVPPRTPTEEVLAAMWSDLLGVERVGTEDGFFELGGHSLLATRVASRVREALGIELPVRAVFEHATLAALASEVDRLRRGAGGVQAPPIVPVPRDGDLPLSFAQERMWFVDRMEAWSATYHMPMALRLRGALDENALQRAVDELVRRHESLRTTFPLVDGIPVQRVAPPGPAAFTLHDLTELRDDERVEEERRLFHENAVVPFSLEAGPLFRVDLAKVSEEEHLFLFNVHHIVFDGWSLEILWRELGALYEAFAAGLPSPLGPQVVQYADFAAWQRAWLQGEVLARELGYWRGALAGAPARLELPADRPRPAVQTHRGGVEGIFLPRESADAVLALARREGATLFMLLLAALDVVLARLSGQDDVVVGTPIAGRTRAETEGVIGLFLNSLALRVKLSGNPTFRELLARVRETTLDAYAHQDVPFERILEEVHPERSTAHTPVFQVMLNLANFVDSSAPLMVLPGLEVGGAGGAEPVSSKFDMTLYAGERPDGLGMRLVYNADLFDAARIRAVLGQLAAVLGQAAENPDLPLASFSLAAEDADSADAERAVRTVAGLPAGVGEPGEVWEKVDGEWRATGAAGRLRPDGTIEVVSAADADSGDAEAEGGLRVAGAELLEEMLAIWREILGDDDVQPDDDFFDLGGHSILGVRLLAMVKKRLGRTLALPALFSNPTPARLAAEVEASAAGKEYEHLVPLTEGGDGAPVFCVHPAGGTVFCYLPLAEALDAGRPFYGIQAAGMEGGELLLTVDQMAERYVDEVRRMQPEGPYHLCGWSAGGIVAFEMAQRLRAAGEEVAFLGLFDSLPPDAELPIPDPIGLYRRLATSLSDASETELDELAAELDELSIDERLPRLAAWLAEHSPQERVSELESLRHVVEVTRATIGASRRHVLKPYAGRMTLFCAEWARGQGWEAAGYADLWRPYVTGRLDVVMVPGLHTSMVRIPYVFGLADAMRDALGAAVPAS